MRWKTRLNNYLWSLKVTFCATSFELGHECVNLYLHVQSWNQYTGLNQYYTPCKSLYWVSLLVEIVSDSYPYFRIQLMSWVQIPIVPIEFEFRMEKSPFENVICAFLVQILSCTPQAVESKILRYMTCTKGVCETHRILYHRGQGPHIKTCPLIA